MKRNLWYSETPIRFAFGPDPIQIVRGKGTKVYDSLGREFLDFQSGMWNVSCGYGQPDIVEECRKQLKTLSYANSFQFTNPASESLATRIVHAAGKPFEKIYFLSSGSEAVELALKLVRQYHHLGRQRTKRGVVSVAGGYHGVTFGALSTNSSRMLRAGYEPCLSGFAQIPMPYCYRCPLKCTEGTCDLRCAQRLARVVESRDNRFAAFISEPVFCSNGAVFPPRGYFELVSDICRRKGLLWIDDEVVCGFGRLGRMFAFESWKNVRPDIVTLGKAISSGYVPLSGVMASSRIVTRIDGRTAIRCLRHGQTNSGHPVACAAGSATMSLYEKHGLVKRAKMLGQSLGHMLRECLGDLDIVGDIRGEGLLWAIEFVRDKKTKTPLKHRFLPDYLERGLLVSQFGHITCLYPPLTTSEAELRTARDIIWDVARRLANQCRGVRPSRR